MSSAVSDLLAFPLKFSHGQKTYKVTLVTQAVKARFERWLRERALEAAGSNERALACVTRDAARGVYAYHGELARDAMLSFDGMIAFAAILFGTDEATMFDILNDKPNEVRSVLQQVFLESAPAEHREKILAAIDGQESEEGKV